MHFGGHNDASAHPVGMQLSSALPWLALPLLILVLPAEAAAPWRGARWRRRLPARLRPRLLAARHASQLLPARHVAARPPGACRHQSLQLPLHLLHVFLQVGLCAVPLQAGPGTGLWAGEP